MCHYTKVLQNVYTIIAKKQWMGLVDGKLLHLEWISNEVLLYSTGNYIQSPGIGHDGKQHNKRIYICMEFPL